jgi:hypothetical protein
MLSKSALPSSSTIQVSEKTVQVNPSPNIVEIAVFQAITPESINKYGSEPY